ncbi:MAG: pyruvate kinase [Pseudomonadota bacterium]|nr:pyruvate kinase [Pseudomonadota bacterium]
MIASNMDALLDLQEQLIQLREEALAMAQRHEADILDCNAELQGSARNLLHYLSVRQRDIRPLQHALSRFGFSALTALEPFTLAHLNAVISLLQALTGRQCETPEPPVDYLTGPHLLHEHARRLLGEIPRQPLAHIMVTMPSEAAREPGITRDLLQAGMNVVRINCAHDLAQDWRAMADHARAASAELGVPCRVQVDLAGPKLRTGEIPSSGRLLKLKPRRDLYGLVLEPCRVWLHSNAGETMPPGLHRPLQVPPEFLVACEVGDRIQLVDSRGQRRKLNIVQVQPGSCIAELKHTAYITDDTRLDLKRGEATVLSTYPQGLEDVVLPILLLQGDRLILTREPQPAQAEQRDQMGELLHPARIHCTVEQAFDQVQPGQRVWFDDGRIGARVEACDGAEMQVCITMADPRGSKLRSEKGINFPDTLLSIPALTDKDLADLEQVAEFADIVALSFVRQAADLEALHQTLNRLQRPETGIVLKIENRQAFENLPRILLTGLRLGRPLGVMIARGDLAVEMGFERLSEVQQEILWLCEAAHVPVIWATQILESMAKKGMPSRAEVTDAAMAVVAECVMLNKGPYIVETVHMLRDILARMDQHYHKRRATLRPLNVARL